MIDEILVSNRQGRNIEGFEQVYADPAVKNALQLGNDTIARTYIRDKLCSLGLMNVCILSNYQVQYTLNCRN